MEIADLTLFAPIALFIVAIFLYSNREVRASLAESKMAEEKLSANRDFLEKQVRERTEELKENRLMRITELGKAAEFGRLAQGLFHDLITPLSSLILHTEKLKDFDAKEIVMHQKSVEKAIEASKRMAVYIKDIRSTLKREESVKDFQMREELDGVLNLLSYKTMRAGISISTERFDDCHWFGDPIKFRQIFSNLIGNAIDSFEAIPENKNKKIEVSLTDMRDSVKIAVEDNGSGISAENMDKIFEPFFTTKSPDKGTGIGLSAVKSIVENDLGGTIFAESEINKGSKFTVNIPKL